MIAHRGTWARWERFWNRHGPGLLLDAHLYGGIAIASVGVGLLIRPAAGLVVAGIALFALGLYGASAAQAPGRDRPSGSSRQGLR